MGKSARALAIALAVALAGCGACGAASSPSPPPAHASGAPPKPTPKPHAGAMDTRAQPYDWIRHGASVYLAHIAQARFDPAGGGQRLTRLEIAIDEALYGPRGAATRRVEIKEPESEMARAKFPTPQWGRVELAVGVALVIATAEHGEALSDPLYVDRVNGPTDPALAELRDVLAAEASAKDPAARRARYLGWLASGEPIHALFGGEALARDEDLPDVDAKGEVAAAFARALGAAKDPLVRGNLVEWAVSGFYARTSEAGRATLIGALLRGAADPDEDVRRTSLDKLSELPLADLDLPGIPKVPAAVPFLEQRLSEETDAAPRARFQKLLDKQRP
jgi:hypothetical protein